MDNANTANGDRAMTIEDWNKHVRSLKKNLAKTQRMLEERWALMDAAEAAGDVKELRDLQYVAGALCAAREEIENDLRDLGELPKFGKSLCSADIIAHTYY